MASKQKSPQDKIREERERKKAEVRARLEASSKKKKGFLTPERKKKLRALLRRKAAEQLKAQQEAKALERRKVIAQRTAAAKAQLQQQPLERLSDNQLVELAKQFHKRIAVLEDEKYDLELEVGKKDYEISSLAFKVNDMRGKFVRPPLRKVPKYEQKIERMLINARKEIGFSVALKSIKKDQLSEVNELRKHRDANKQMPDWSWKKQRQDSAATSAQLS